MANILLIGGSKDGEIVDEKFIQDGHLPFIKGSLVSRRIGGESAPVELVEMDVETYLMDKARIDGRFYAYATCRSIQGNEVIDIIKTSKLTPIE